MESSNSTPLTGINVADLELQDFLRQTYLETLDSDYTTLDDLEMELDPDNSVVELDDIEPDTFFTDEEFERLRALCDELNMDIPDVNTSLNAYSPISDTTELHTSDFNLEPATLRLRNLDVDIRYALAVLRAMKHSSFTWTDFETGFRDGLVFALDKHSYSHTLAVLMCIRDLWAGGSVCEQPELCTAIDNTDLAFFQTILTPCKSVITLYSLAYIAYHDSVMGIVDSYSPLLDMITRHQQFWPFDPVNNAAANISAQVEAVTMTFLGDYAALKADISAFFKDATSVSRIISMVCKIIILYRSRADYVTVIACLTDWLLTSIKDIALVGSVIAVIGRNLKICWDWLQEHAFGDQIVRMPQGPLGDVVTKMIDYAPFVVPFCSVVLTLLSTYTLGTLPSYDSITKMMKGMSNLGRAVSGFYVVSDAVSYLITKCLDSLHLYIFGYPRVGDGMDAYVPGVDEWMQSVQSFVDLSKRDEIHTNPTYACNIAALYHQSLKMQSVVNQSHVPANLKCSFAAHMRALTPMYQEAVLSGAYTGGEREEPFIIYLVGDPGCGKSYCMNLLNLVALAELGYDPAKYRDLVYNRRVEQDFWCGYSTQPVVNVDEFMANVDSVANPDPQILEFLHWKSPAELPLNMAHLTEKDITKFQAKVIIMTGNDLNLSAPSLRCREALLRRFDMVLKVSNFEEYVSIRGGKPKLDSKKVLQRTGKEISTDVYKFVEWDMLASRARTNEVCYVDMLAELRRRLREHFRWNSKVSSALQEYAETLKEPGQKTYLDGRRHLPVEMTLPGPRDLPNDTDLNAPDFDIDADPGPQIGHRVDWLDDFVDTVENQDEERHPQGLFDMIERWLYKDEYDIARHNIPVGITLIRHVLNNNIDYPLNIVHNGQLIIPRRPEDIADITDEFVLMEQTAFNALVSYLGFEDQYEFITNLSDIYNRIRNRTVFYLPALGTPVSVDFIVDEDRDSAFDIISDLLDSGAKFVKLKLTGTDILRQSYHRAATQCSGLKQKFVNAWGSSSSLKKFVCVGAVGCLAVIGFKVIEKLYGKIKTAASRDPEMDVVVDTVASLVPSTLLGREEMRESESAPTEPQPLLVRETEVAASSTEPTPVRRTEVASSGSEPSPARRTEVASSGTEPSAVRRTEHNTSILRDAELSASGSEPLPLRRVEAGFGPSDVTEEEKLEWESITNLHRKLVLAIGRSLGLGEFPEHDLSKFSREEYPNYIRVFVRKDLPFGDPVAKETYQIHYSRNPHHPEFWTNSVMSTDALKEAVADMIAVQSVKTGKVKDFDTDFDLNADDFIFDSSAPYATRFGDRLPAVLKIIDSIRYPKKIRVPTDFVPAKCEPPRVPEAIGDVNADELRRLLVPNQVRIHFGPRGQINGLGIGDRVVLVNRHFVTYLSKCSVDTISVQLVGGRDPITVPVSTINFVQFPDGQRFRDLAAIQLPTIFPQFKTITKHFITREELGLICKSTPAVLCSMRSVDTKYGKCMTQLHSRCVAKKNDFTYTDATTGDMYDVRNGYDYDVETASGDCGAPLVSLYGPLKRPCIIGVHCSGGKTGGYGFGSSCSVTQEDVVEALRKFGAMEVRVPQGVVAFEEQVVDGFVPIGKCEKYNARSSTKIRPSKLAKVYCEPTTRPVNLHKWKDSEGEVQDPLLTRLKTYGKTPVYMDQNLLDKAVEDMKCMYAEKKADYPRVLTMEEAVQGIDGEIYLGSIQRNTSAGFGWSKGKRGKYHVLGRSERPCATPSLKEAVDAIVDDAKHNIRTIHPYVVIGKDERKALKDEKWKKPRIIQACPVDYLVVIRMYFLGFVQFLMTHRVDLESCVGVNVFSSDWGRIVAKLRGKGTKMIAGDFSGFDSSQTGQLHNCVLKLINEWYSAHGATEEENLIRTVLFQDICSSVFVFEEDVLQSQGKLPSGNPLTVIVNSIVNSLLDRYIYFSIFKGTKFAPISMYRKHVALVCYGDDYVKSVDDIIADKMTYETVTAEYAKIGFVHTDETKSEVFVPHKSLEDVMFLKRAFCWNNEYGVWDAPLLMSSIQDMCLWIKSDSEIDVWTRLNAETAVRELAFHPREVYDVEARRLVEACREVGIMIPDEKYDEMRILNADFNWYLASDGRLNAERAGRDDPGSPI